MTSTYPSYKPTPIPWLPQIPEHWELLRNKYILQEVIERSNSGMEDLLSVSQYTGVTLKKDKLENDDDLLTSAATLEGYKKVQKDDLVINIMLAWNGSLGVSPYDGITSPAYSVYRFNEKINPKYFHYLFRTKAMSSYFRSVSSGVIESRLRMYTIDFFKLYSFIPPLPEQTAIANYLDAKTDEINTFIAKKEKLIALLKEQKQAIINELLQDKEGKWERIKLKFLARVRTGRTPSIEKSKIDFFKEGSINWITPGDFNDDYILAESARKIIPQAISGNEVELFNPYSLYLIGIGGTLGKVGLSPNSASANQQINVISFSNKILPEFGLFYFQSIREFLFKTADYTTLPILNQSKTKNIKVPVPKFAEQEDIVKQIKVKHASVDQVIKRINKEIELVKELKQSLIAEVVTGKIKIT